MKKVPWRALVYLVPLLFCYWLHQLALRGWFWQDDFAWLGLHTQVYDRASFLRAMFEPLAQGTIRPWSERGFFLLFFRLFGLDALPYHGLVMGTQFVNLLLLSWIVRKLGGSRLAACAAPVLWAANAALVIPVGWASDYNQILCAFFLLAAFALYLGGHYYLQVAVFLLGFGALEINVVYPALLLSWLLLARKSIKPAVPLLVVSAVYYLVHRHFALPATGGPYALHFDAGLFSTLGSYWKQSWMPEGWHRNPFHSPWLARIAIALLTAAVVAVAIRIPRAGLFFLAWFLVTLAPVLPLRDHISSYYLAIPTLGLAAMLALALDVKSFVLPAVACAALYLWIQIPTARLQSRWYFERSREVRALVLGTVRARELHPGQTILLAHVPPELYAFSIAHSPFHAAGLEDVYLTPDTGFSTFAGLEPPAEFTLPAGPTMRGLAMGQVEIYQPGTERIRNITATYTAWARKNISFLAPARVDVGIPLMQYLLGSTWYPPEGTHRWMPARATVRIAAPQTPKQRLVITGYCPQEQTSSGPLQLQISINGNEVSGEVFSKPEMPFVRSISVPPSLIGNAEMEVELAVSRTFQGPERGRNLGLAFGIFEIR
jgi:hypothetical protein